MFNFLQVKTEENIQATEDIDELETYSNTPLKIRSTACSLEVSCKFHDYCGELTMPSSVNKETQTCEMYTSDTASTQTDIQMKDSSTQTEPDKVMKSIGIQCVGPDIVFEDIAGDKDDVMFYTGVPDAGTFNALFEVCICYH